VKPWRKLPWAGDAEIPRTQGKELAALSLGLPPISPLPPWVPCEPFAPRSLLQALSQAGELAPRGRWGWGWAMARGAALPRLPQLSSTLTGCF